MKIAGVAKARLRAITMVATLAAPLAADAAALQESTTRLIVKLRATAPHAGEPLERMSIAAAMPLAYLRAMSGGAHVLALPHAMAISDARVIAERLIGNPDIEYAEPDRKRYRKLTPNDSLFNQQWNLFEAIGGINTPGAWDITTGSAGLVIAVLDTGILTHQDLDPGRQVAGYDFVSADMPGAFLTANDGDARDPDPSDPGDWITQAESSSGFFRGCTVDDSSWHGTHNAGIIGAASNNALGVAGINWVSRILPLRVLGKCGGYTSDILDAARWAAGLAVPNVPNNQNRAQVINASLGGSGACSLAEQSAVNDVLAAGVRAFVVPSGNENGNANDSSPANCPGVITVAATTRSGTRASYSNTGSVVAISAPGGQFTTDPASGANGILSLLNTGTTTPATDAFAFLQGTSFSTSHVSGVVSLMLSVNPGLSAAQVRAILQSTARPFADGSCTTATCGAGIVDANAAVRLAQGGLTANPQGASFANTVVNQQTTQSITFTNVGINALSLGQAAIGGPQAGDFRLASDACSNQALATQASCVVSIAFIPAAAGTRQAQLDVPSSAATSPSRVSLAGAGVAPAPAPSDGGGGGGCAIVPQAKFDPLLLLLMAAALLRRCFYTRRETMRAFCV